MTEEQREWTRGAVQRLREWTVSEPGRVEIQDLEEDGIEFFANRPGMIRTAALLLECSLMDRPSSVAVPDAVNTRLYLSDVSVLDGKREELADRPVPFTRKLVGGVVAVYVVLSLILGLFTLPYWIYKLVH